MDKKMEYTDEQMGKTRRVDDCLPPPEELALKDDTIKITISLTRRSVEFFKQEAALRNTQYQKMIRSLLDEYAVHHQ